MAGAYLLFRFNGPILLKPDGLYLGIWGKVLSYWKPVECQIRTDTSDRSLHFLTVRGDVP